MSGPTIKAPFLRAYSSEFLELGAGICLRKSIISSLFPIITPSFAASCLRLLVVKFRDCGLISGCVTADFMVFNISAWSVVTQLGRATVRQAVSRLFLQRMAQVPLVRSWVVLSALGATFLRGL